jgi:hypothetical protein
MNVFFSHSSGILPFLANFGIGKSEDNFNVTNILAENEARKYRISRLDPMNSNIVFVLFAFKNDTNNQTSADCKIANSMKLSLISVRGFRLVFLAEMFVISNN